MNARARSIGARAAVLEASGNDVYVYDDSRHPYVELLGPRSSEAVLEIGCSLGQCTVGLARRAGQVWAMDVVPEQAEFALLRASEEGLQNVHAAAGGEDGWLPFADASFDVVSIAFGIRNVADPDRALAQFARVLRPAGRLVVLEFDRPRNPLVRWGNHLFSAVIMPRTATLISRDRSGAYLYLPASVAQFRSRDEMIRGITRAGFSEVAATPLTFGICACYRATRPG